MAIVADLAGTAPLSSQSGQVGVDRKLATPNRNLGNSPYGVTAPLYPGETVLDTSTGQMWCSSAGLGVTNWVPVTKVV